MNPRGERMSADGLFLGTDRGDARYRAVMEQAIDAVLDPVADHEDSYSARRTDPRAGRRGRRVARID